MKYKNLMNLFIATQRYHIQSSLAGATLSTGKQFQTFSDGILIFSSAGIAVHEEQLLPSGLLSLFL